MSRNNQFSFGDFVWFTGTVVDVNDPLKSGRVKVRIFEYHADSVTDEQLPWSMIATSVMSASTGGIGITPHMLVKNAHVIGFFVDGTNAQLPMVMFSFPGMNNGVPDVSKHARGEAVSQTLDSNSQWSEKASGAQPEYPHNKVMNTPSGHIVEIDDTPGKERLHVMHKSGTFHEFHTDGSVVSSVKGENYQIVQKGLFIHVHGNANLVVDGNVTETIGGNKTSNIKGNYSITCSSYSMQIKGSWTNKVGSSGLIKCGGSLTQKGSTIFLN